MIKVKYNELTKLKEFGNKGRYLQWLDNVDEYMGFTIVKAKATEGELGIANLRYTEEFVFDGNSKETVCSDSRLLAIIEKRLIKLFDENKVNYQIVS